MSEIIHIDHNGVTTTCAKPSNATKYEIKIPINNGHYIACRLNFQDGPITKNQQGTKEGMNGITNEAILSILIHRLEYFISTYGATGDNAPTLRACLHLSDALANLESRTLRRIKKNIESSHQQLTGTSQTPKENLQMNEETST